MTRKRKSPTGAGTGIPMTPGAGGVDDHHSTLRLHLVKKFSLPDLTATETRIILALSVDKRRRLSIPDAIHESGVSRPAGLRAVRRLVASGILGLGRVST